MVYVEKAQEPIKNYRELISEFSKASKNKLCFNISAKQTNKKTEFKNITPFIISQKIFKLPTHRTSMLKTIKY